MTVRDRKKRESEKARVVNLPPIPAKDYVLYHDGQEKVTVADKNPEYDKYTSVVIIVNENTLREHFPEYTADPIPLKTLSEQGIKHFVYPPERLRPINNGVTDYDGLTPVSEISTKTYKERTSEIIPSEPDDVLADEDSPHKYDTGQNQLSETSSTGNDRKEISNSSSIDTEKVTESTNTQKQRHSQETDGKVRSPEGEHNESVSEPPESEIKEPTADTLQEEPTTADSSVAEPGSTSTQETTDTNTTVNEGSRSEVSLDKLRERAKENEVEEVTQKAATTTTEKTQYHRTPAIKEYVKARAEGYCEGCGEPAPFNSKTGDPYLHAHHLHELSDGGSDTIDTVIALCPNCHYRVHHGNDGRKYNKNLLEKIQRLENS